MLASKLAWVGVVGLCGAAVVYPPCEWLSAMAIPSSGADTVQAPDTAMVRLHISGMTCGTCPTTARLALKRVSGVYSATVTLNDSLGVVRYDRRRVAATQLADSLRRLTGFRATILADSTETPRSHS